MQLICSFYKNLEQKMIKNYFVFNFKSNHQHNCLPCIRLAY